MIFGYDEGATQGYTRDDYIADMIAEEKEFRKTHPIIVEELDCMVKQYAREEGYAEDCDLLKEWNKIKDSLEEHEEPVPSSDWYTDEYGNWQQDYTIEKVNGSARVDDEELSSLLWKLGCTFAITQDWHTGDIQEWVSLPTSQEEYERNIKEGTDNWNENYE